MKKIIAMLCAVAMVSACTEKNTITSDGKLVEALSSNEVCYEGMKYVKFGGGNAAWGSLKFDTNGKPMSCTTNDIEGTEGCYQNVVYVRFGYDKPSWGSVKFNKEGTVVTCGRAVPQPLEKIPQPETRVNTELSQQQLQAIQHSLNQIPE